jgi:hypothetical protein
MPRYAFHFRLFGTRVLVHWQFMLALPICWLVMRSGSGGYLGFLSLLALSLAHEFGHAALARYCGRDVERIELFFLQGTCVHAECEYEIERIVIAWGGALVQLALMLVFALLYHMALQLPRPAFHFLEPIFAIFIAWNAVTLFVNLAPVDGQDGKIAWRIFSAIGDGTCAGFLRARHDVWRFTRSQARKNKTQSRIVEG